MKKYDYLTVSYILIKYLSTNQQYLSGTLDRLPIYKDIVCNYSEEEIQDALYFLNNHDILTSSCNESNKQILIYSLHKYKSEFFIDLFWKESSRLVRIDCIKILGRNK